MPGIVMPGSRSGQVSGAFTWRNPGIFGSRTVFSQFFLEYGLKDGGLKKVDRKLEVDWKSNRKSDWRTDWKWTGHYLSMYKILAK